MEAFAGGLVVGGGNGTLTLVDVEDGDGAVVGGGTHKSQVSCTCGAACHTSHATRHTSRRNFQSSI
jgi:hypothetical protein